MKDRRGQTGSGARALASVLAAISIVSILILAIWGRDLDATSEAAMFACAAFILLPFVSYLALAIQLWVLYRRTRGSAKRLSAAKRASLSMLGPLGMAWAVFLLTEPPTGSRPESENLSRGR